MKFIRVVVGIIILIGLKLTLFEREGLASETKDGIPKIASPKPQVQSPNSSKDLDCKPPLLSPRAFIIIKAQRVKSSSTWELMPPQGDTPDWIDCDQRLYRTIDVADGEGVIKNFYFASKTSCLAALTKLQSAASTNPTVVVVDVQCTAQIAE